MLLRFREFVPGMLLVALLSFAGQQAEASEGVLRSGSAQLTLSSGGSGSPGIRLSLSAPGGPPSHYNLPLPLSVEVVDQDRQARWVRAEYASVVAEGGAVRCEGTAESRAGTRFRYSDVFTALDEQGAFALDRTVRVSHSAASDCGFLSCFTLYDSAEAAVRDYEYFAPAVWYRRNEHARPSALASDLSHDVYLFREGRLTLPLVMMRDTSGGSTLSLIHRDAVPSTFAGEDGLNRIIDQRIRFASIGVQRILGRTGLALWYPGTEGDKTYVYGPSRQRRWAPRSHPVRDGFSHAYRVIVRLNRTPDFVTAMRDAWRYAWQLYQPPVIKADLDAVYRDSLNLLNGYAREYNGVIGLPFNVTLPDGKIKHVSYLMGFVGQQIPAAYHMLRHGLRTGRADSLAKGEAMLDFWASRCLMPDGAARTWFDVRPQQQWRQWPAFIRTSSDGVRGMLQGWHVMKRHGHDRPEWLRFCTRYADWLVRKQNPDGSFCRSYDFHGNVIHEGKLNTTHPLPLLVELWLATRRKSYLEAAKRAGEFCWANVHKPLAYVGGTPDNPYVTDKEAGLEALDAFLALYDVTRDPKWLEAAVRAADFSETWMYAYNVPMPPGDPKCDFPLNANTCGLSIIALGWSGADTAMMASYAFHYYRLYLYTRDRHYLDVARILHHNPKQTIDVAGSMGYARPGLQTEAMTLALPRGHSVKVWPPWLTVATLDPMVLFEETFGSKDIDTIEKLPLARRKALNDAFATHRGMAPTRAPRRKVTRPRVVYLDNLKELSCKVGYGTLGKKGSHGYGPATVAVNNVKAQHALSTHPPANGKSFVRYRVNGEYRKFSATVAISDAAPKPCSSPLTFRVLGDGKLLWQSRPVRQPRKPALCRISIGRVRVLTLEVDCLGPNAWAFAVWIDPRIER